MTQIICTKCHEVLELTADSVQLPFICSECIAAAEFQNLISPDPMPISRPVTLAVVDELDHESATVEATTLLIADLEQQVKQTKGALKTANAAIIGLTFELNRFRLDEFEEWSRRLVLSREISYLKLRGFWARVFNKGV